MPYYSRWRTIDIYGLNDPHIARHGRDPAYVLAQHPDLVVLISTHETEFPFPPRLGAVAVPRLPNR